MGTLLTDVADGVATITLNRPDRLNALTWPLMDELRDAIVALGRDQHVRALVLTGAGRGFSVGADLAEAAGRTDLAGWVDAGTEHSANPLIEAVTTAEVPVLAAVNGPCAGASVGLALLADVTVAARSAYFLVTNVNPIGIVPDMGSSWALGRRAGRARALGMTLLGDRISAEQAADWGLIWACVDDDTFSAEVGTIAGRLAGLDAGAVRATRALVDAAPSTPLTEHLARERQGVVGQLARPDVAGAFNLDSRASRRRR